MVDNDLRAYSYKAQLLCFWLRFAIPVLSFLLQEEGCYNNIYTVLRYESALVSTLGDERMRILLVVSGLWCTVHLVGIATGLRCLSTQRLEQELFYMYIKAV